jgi:hypothetical protein
MKRAYLLPMLALVLMAISCKKEISVEPPEIIPPIIVTPKDNYLIKTVSISFDGGGGLRDSIRLEYNSKNQLTDVYFNEGQPATYFGHSTYFYNETGNVIKSKAYHLPNMNAPGSLTWTDSLKWASNNQFLDYGISTDGVITNVPTAYRLNGDGQINYYNNPRYTEVETYEYQDKDVSKLVTTDKQGKAVATGYEYGDKHNPFYQLFIQNSFFYDATFYASMYFSFSEHNVVKITTEGSYSNISYKIDEVTGLITEQKQTRIYPSSPSRVTTSTFSYIKAQ